MLANTFVSVLSKASTANVSVAVYDVIFNSPPVTVLSLNTTLEIALTFTLASLNVFPVITIDFTSWPFSLSLIPRFQLINSLFVIVTVTSLVAEPAPSPKIIALVLFVEPLPMNVQLSTVKFDFAEIALNLPPNPEIASDISIVKFLTTASASNLNADK